MENPPGSADQSAAAPALSASPVETGLQSHSALIGLAPFLGPPREPGTLASMERFHLVRLLGIGGMGLVFLARDPAAAQSALFAVKLLKPELAGDPRARNYFLKEAGHGRRLKHPHIAPVLEVGETGGLPWFTLPYYAGGSLAARLKPGSFIAPDDVVRLGRDIAGALAEAHRAGVIHRDVKPGNILFADDGRACLADFGLARSLFNDSLMLGEAGMPLGTLAYQSPAVARGDVEDTRGDIYALGAVLYEMLAGRPPYEGSSVAQMRQQIAAGPPRPILELNRKAPTELVRVVEGAMAREVSRRYTTASELQEDLERLAAKRLVRGPRSARVRQLVQAAWAGVAGIALLGAASWAWKEWKQPFRLVATTTLPPGVFVYDIRPGDWNGDGETDLLAQDGRLVSAYDRGGTLLESRRFGPDNAERLELDGAVLFPARTAAEALPWSSSLSMQARWFDGTNALVGIFNHNGFMTARFEFTGARPAKPVHARDDRSNWLNGLAVTDLSGRGAPDFLTSIRASYSLQPRGLVCYDALTGSNRWTHFTAGSPDVLGILGPDATGRSRVLYEGYGSANGSRLPDGTSDRETYLGLVDADGKLLQRRVAGPFYTHVLKVPRDRTQGGGLSREMKPEPTAVCVLTVDPQLPGLEDRPETGRVFRVDAEGNEIASHDFGKWILSSVRADLAGDGKEMVLVADRTGVLTSLDPSLKPVHRTPIVDSPKFNVRSQIVCAEDLDGDGRKEIVVFCFQEERPLGEGLGHQADAKPPVTLHDIELVLFDADLKVVGRRLIDRRRGQQNPFSPWVADQPGRKSKEILLLSDRAQWLSVGR